MPKYLTNVLKYVIPLGIAAILLYFSFRNIEFSGFLEKAKQADYRWVIASIVLSLLAYVSRAYRWQLLYKPLGYQPTVYRLSLAIVVGYLANLAFPRLGEITRCGIVHRTDNIPIAKSFGTVITDRIVDAVMLLSLTLFSFILEYDKITTFFTTIVAEYNIDFNKIIAALVGLSIVGVVGIYLVFIMNNTFTQKIKSFTKDIIEGVLSIRKLDNIPGFLISTIVIWVTYYLMSYLIVFSLPETSVLTVSAGFMLLITGGLAISLPVQGGIGTYHAMVSAMLILYGIDQTTGLFLATLLHTSQIVGIGIFGGIGLLLSLAIGKKNVANSR